MYSPSCVKTPPNFAFVAALSSLAAYNAKPKRMAMNVSMRSRGSERTCLVGKHEPRPIALLLEPDSLLSSSVEDFAAELLVSFSPVESSACASPNDAFFQSLSGLWRTMAYMGDTTGPLSIH